MKLLADDLKGAQKCRARQAAERLSDAEDGGERDDMIGAARHGLQDADQQRRAHEEHGGEGEQRLADVHVLGAHEIGGECASMKAPIAISSTE